MASAFYNEWDTFPAQWLRNLQLRAAGNAIVPQQAARFIRAFLGVMNDLR
jgi:hypothetical protein